VERAWRGGVNRLTYANVYRPAGGSGEERFLDNRIHARAGFTWRYPCHECLVADAGEKSALVPDLQILHAIDDAKPRDGYLPLLELAAREAPDDPRCAHYLGRQLLDLKRYDEAATELERYFTLPHNGFAAERNATLRFLAHACEGLGEIAAAMGLFRRAVFEAPSLRGAWVELAWAYHRREIWEECLTAAERAMAFPDTTRTYGDDTSPGVVAEDLACLAAWALARPKDALAYGRAARAKAPGSGRIRANLARIEKALAGGEAQAFGVSSTPLAGTPDA
jgi:tetratricopeptide (TPR) repeat protein